MKAAAKAQGEDIYEHWCGILAQICREVRGVRVTTQRDGDMRTEKNFMILAERIQKNGEINAVEQEEPNEEPPAAAAAAAAAVAVVSMERPHADGFYQRCDPAVVQ